METIKFKNCCPVYIHSKEEWVELNGNSKGFYNPNTYDIHILREEDFPEIYMWGKKVEWIDVLYHEYIHYLQHLKGCWGDMIPLGEKSIPMSKAFKSFYHPDDWKIEAEAHYYMYRPTSLGIQLVLA